MDALFHYPSEAKTKKRSFAWKGFIYLVLRFCYNNEAKPKPKIDTGSFLETKLSNLSLMLQFKLICCFRVEKKFESLRVKNFRSHHQRAEAAITYVASIFNLNEKLSYYL